jgi:hypothetical protein
MVLDHGQAELVARLDLDEDGLVGHGAIGLPGERRATPRSDGGRPERPVSYGPATTGRSRTWPGYTAASGANRRKWVSTFHFVAPGAGHRLRAKGVPWSSGLDTRQLPLAGALCRRTNPRTLHYGWVGWSQIKLPPNCCATSWELVTSRSRGIVDYREDASHPSARYGPGVDSPAVPSCARISLPHLSFRNARTAGLGEQGSSLGSLRSWLLLAWASPLSPRQPTEDEQRVLEREAGGEPRSRPAQGARIAETGLPRIHDLAMRTR